MSKVFRPYDSEQMLLMPMLPQEWLPPNHLPCLISGVVSQVALAVFPAR